MPLEKIAALHQFRDACYMKSGAQTPVWLLPIPMEEAYLLYRRNYGDMVQGMMTEDPDSYDTMDQSTCAMDLSIARNNVRLVSEQGPMVQVEPWGDHCSRLRKWTLARKGAGLKTSINPRCIAFNGEKMVFLDVEQFEDHDGHPMDKPDTPMDEPDTPDVQAMSDDAEEVQEVQNRKLRKQTIARADQVDVLHLWETQRLESKRLRNMLRPRDYQTWVKWLNCDPAFKWRAVSQPYNCDVCDNAHLTRTDHRVINKRHVQLELEGKRGTSEFMEVNGKLDKSAKKLDALNRHHRQYENQRPFIRILEDALPDRTDTEWHIIVFEDFVAQYNYRKKKVANLVFTVKWRDRAGTLQYKYIDNFCSDKSQSADATYVVTCWQAHLRYNQLQKELARLNGADANNNAQSPEAAKIRDALKKLDGYDGYWKEFAGVTHVTRTGDNGGHLLNKLSWLTSSRLVSIYTA
jgi:hypothetical protein